MHRGVGLVDVDAVDRPGSRGTGSGRRSTSCAERGGPAVVVGGGREAQHLVRAALEVGEGVGARPAPRARPPRGPAARWTRATAGPRRTAGRGRWRRARSGGRPSTSSPRSRREAVDRAGHGELGGAQAGDEVAAAHLAPLLQRLQHRVHAGEAALGALAQRRLAGEHAVALEQLEGPGVGGLGGRWAAARAAARPATSDRPRPAGRGEPAAGPRATAGAGPRRPTGPPSDGRRRRRRRAAAPASRW